MSGPWEEFAPTTAATPAGVELQPWEQFAGAPAAAPAPPPAKTSQEVKAGVETLLKNRAPLEVIKKFVEGSGHVIDPKTNDWLEKNYAAYSAPDAPAQHYDVNVHGKSPEVSTGEAVWRGIQSGALRGFDDELSGISGAVGNEIGSALGMNQSDAPFWDRYAAIRDRQQQAKDSALQDHPLAYAAGFVPGALTGPTYFRNPSNALSGRVAQASGTAAIEGALSGAGNADGGLADRAIGAGEGGVLGGVLGALLYPAGAAASGVAARVAERLRPANGANALNSGLDVLASRAPQNEADMLARAEAMRQAGVPPRLVDVVDESGRGVVRSAANKMTPAREELAQHANTVYADAQDRVAQQARTHVSDSPITARQLGDRIGEEQKAMGPRFDAVRDEPVALTPEITQALNTAEGRNVLRTIGRYMTPTEQSDLNALVKGMQQAAKLGTVEQQAEKLVPGFSRMSPAAQQQIIGQLDIKDPMAGVKFTVDMADKFARIIKHRAGENPGMMRVAKNYADTIRGAARAQHPAYDEALNDFEAVSRVGDAAAGTGKYENTDFLRSPPDQYGKAVSDAGNTRPDFALPTEREAMQIRARDEIVDKATAGSGAGAPGVARQIAQGSAQRARNEALLGPERARQFESGMRSELTRVENTRYVDPRIGSKTAPMAEDAAAESAHFALDAASHGKWGVIRGVSRWLKGAGIRGIDAERLTRDAISDEPARVNDAIAYLTQKGMDDTRARGLVRQIQRNMKKLPGRAAGAYVSDEQSQPPPNSVRVLLRERPQ